MFEENLFIVSWDCYGLEGIIDLTQWHSETTFQVLQDKPYQRLDSIIQSLVLRARFNSHRNYEIYSVRTDINITERVLREMFDENPDSAAELVRAHGVAIHSDRELPNRRKIT